jgi:CelD/BcsL family acetyltransferase involved in cellulose biosynthesis
MLPQLTTQAIPGGLLTDVITDAAAFTQLLPEWDALLSTTPSANPFLKAAWIDSWRRHAMDGQALHVIAVRDHGRLVAVAPLMRTRRGFGFSERLEFLGAGPAGADYLDLMVSDESSTVAIDAIAAAVHAQQLPLYLDHLPPSARATRLAAKLAQSGWTSLESTPDVCPFINLSGHTWDSFLATLGSAHRANIRRRIRAVENDFSVEFCLVDSQHARRTALDRLVQFSEQRWKTRGGTSAFPDSQLIAFHHSVTRMALTEGWLRFYTLSLNGVLIGVMYGFAIDDRFYFFQHGFDDAYAPYSAGLVLMALTVRAAIESGTREFDMLYGHETYKSLWAREQRPLSRLQLFPPRLSGSILRRQAETRQALRLMANQLRLRTPHDHS